MQTSLGKGPDAPQRVRCVRPVPNPRHFDVLTQVRPIVALLHLVPASGATFSTKTLSNRELSKMKFGSLDLRTFSELPSARFTKCAAHLNLMPCLGQATCSMPPLIVRSKEKQSPKLL